MAKNNQDIEKLESIAKEILDEIITDVVNNSENNGNVCDSEEEEDEDNFNKKKIPFKLKQNSNGNLLTIHHTVKDKERILRIRLGVFAFGRNSSQLVAIDKRGNIFVFDLIAKCHWRLSVIICKATVITTLIYQKHQYLVGNKEGQLFQLDVDNSKILNAVFLVQAPVLEISFPGQPLQPSKLALVHAGHQAILINLETFQATHRLDFDEVRISLKFACFLPHSEQIFTCFTNDNIHIWSGVTLKTLRMTYPLKTRDRKLNLSSSSIPEITLSSSGTYQNINEFQLFCNEQDFTFGTIASYCFTTDGSVICLSTMDNYLMVLSSYTFELQNLIHLIDFNVKQCAFLQIPKECLIFALTYAGQVVLLNCHNTDLKLIIQSKDARSMSVSNDGKFLAILSITGEINLWSTNCLFNMLKSQELSRNLLKCAFKQNKPVVYDSKNECLKHDLKKHLRRDRLLAILKEYGHYPEKYRQIIWSHLLELPYNKNEFQLLLKLPTPLIIRRLAQSFKLKNESLRLTLVRVWSCLSLWCKVFAYSSFLPGFIFPFVKFFPKNAHAVFEICVSLLLNHFHLWFEFHPLEPTNYLGLCQNVLQKTDVQLLKFFGTLEIETKHYAWSLLSTAFSEVLDEGQWLILWDNILSAPTYFPIFCAVAYNILQREILLRLPDKDTIIQFFHEQNPIDISKLVLKAFQLMENCADSVHPKRYIKEYTSIPKNVYPKFLNYPKKLVKDHEENLLKIEKEQYKIDNRLRQLELEEYKLIDKLEKSLKDAEHSKRLKEMENVYQETLRREEARVAYQRKMLLLYQKEIRNRKCEVLATMQETERRRQSLEMQKELDMLTNSIELERMRNDSNILLVEDEIHHQDIELLSQKMYNSSYEESLQNKYKSDVRRLRHEQATLHSSMQDITSTSRNTECVWTAYSLETIEKELKKIQKEFLNLKSK